MHAKIIVSQWSCLILLANTTVIQEWVSFSGRYTRCTWLKKYCYTTQIGHEAAVHQMIVTAGSVQEQGGTHEDSRDSRIFTLEDDLHSKHKRDISQGIPSVARTVIEKENSLLVDQRVKSTLNFVDKISRRDNCNFLKRQRFYFTSCLQHLLWPWLQRSVNSDFIFGIVPLNKPKFSQHNQFTLPGSCFR